MGYDDDEGGPEYDALQAIMDMLESKGGELMKEKYGPKDEPKDGAPVAHGHVVTVEIKPHAPGQEGGAKDDDLTEDMLEHLLGDGDDGDEKE